MKKSFLIAVLVVLCFVTQINCTSEDDKSYEGADADAAPWSARGHRQSGKIPGVGAAREEGGDSRVRRVLPVQRHPLHPRSVMPIQCHAEARA